MTTTDPTPHPARFSDAILDTIAPFLQPGWRVVDPFAGVGRIHELGERVGCQTVGVELEREWAWQHPQTIVGDARELVKIVGEKSADAVVTSCCYGNRMADHQDAKERCKVCAGTGVVPGSDRLFGGNAPDESCKKCGGKGHRDYKRITYKHYLGRDLTSGNSGAMQWGDEYRALHRSVWVQVLRVLKPNPESRFILNISNHVRKGKVARVAEWHMNVIMGELGFQLEAMEAVPTQRMRFGANRDARVENEWVLVFSLPRELLPDITTDLTPSPTYDHAEHIAQTGHTHPPGPCPVPKTKGYNPVA